MSHKFKGNVRVDGNLNLPSQTANRASVVDGSGNLSSSSVTSTELGYVSGVTSSIQTQLGNKAAAADVADLVTLSGVAVNSTTLGSFSGAIISDNETVKGALQDLETFIEALPDPVVYKGLWNASTNTPTLDNADTGVAGFLYYVSVAGSVDFGAGSISFEVGDKVVNNGTTWDKWDMTDAVASVNGQTGVVSLDSDDISEGATNLYFTDERAQDAVGTILADSSSIDFTYSDGTPSITAAVLPAGVDHDQLLNFVANEHVDHSAVSIGTAADSGLTGGGDITASRNLSVDINGTTAESSADNADKILIYDNSASVLKSMTRANFLSGIPAGSAGDINETSFSGADGQAAPANVTGLAFANATVRSFKALVSVLVDATADLYESFEILGIQKGSSWEIAVSSTGDDSQVAFSITNAGQIQYTSGTYAGFSSMTVKFRAITTTV